MAVAQARPAVDGVEERELLRALGAAALLARADARAEAREQRRELAPELALEHPGAHALEERARRFVVGAPDVRLRLQVDLVVDARDEPVHLVELPQPRGRERDVAELVRRRRHVLGEPRLVP